MVIGNHITKASMECQKPEPVKRQGPSGEARVAQGDAKNGPDAGKSPDTGKARTNVQSLEEHLSRKIELEIDKETGTIVAKIIDDESGEVIRQIPQEETLEMIKALKEKGVLVSEEV
jgi:flagellar protein FlaG